MNYKSSLCDQKSETNIHSSFLNDLSSMEDAFFSLIENMESDR